MRKTVRNIALCLALGVGVMAHSQSVDIERGDAHLEIFEFEKALEEYKKAYEYDTTSAEATRKIANTYRRKGDLETSSIWYEKTLALDPSQKEDMLHFAEALKSQKRYKESLEWYRKYNSIEPDDERASNHIEKEEIFTEAEEDTLETIFMKSLQINNRKPAFGVTTVDDKLLFSAANMGGNTTGNKTNPWNDLPYLDVYEGTVDEYNEIVDVTSINEINSKYNDGPAHFSNALNTIFVTRNNMKRGKPVKDKTGSVNLKIYASNRNEDGSWGDMYDLPFNSDDYSCGHPCITPNGRFMYFSSNQPGGEGGTDLYVSENINGTWSTPVNLGKTVNTKGDEMFPYIDDNGVMYFSSTGHAGLGGLDIFKVALEDVHTKEPVNIGHPMNSPKDDFSIVFQQTDVSGFVCSNRDRGFSDNIYYFEINSLMNKLLAGRIESSLPDKSLAGTELIIRNTTTGEEESVILDDTGKFEFEGKAGETYELAYQKEDTEEILTTKTVEDVIADEFENLGVFTIYERMDVTVYDDSDSLEINDVMYKRFNEDGSFVSEKGDTISSAAMMDMLARNIDGNDLEINDIVYNYDADSDTYTDENGDEVPDDELEQLLMSQIFANPLMAIDGSLLAGTTLEDNIGDFEDIEASIPDYLAEQQDLSAMEMLTEKLKEQSLSGMEYTELEMLRDEENLESQNALDYINSLTENPDLLGNLTEVELKALGLDATLTEEEKVEELEKLATELDGDSDLTAMELIENQLTESALAEVNPDLINTIDDSELNDVTAKDYIDAIVENPELVSELSAMELKALGLECEALEIDPDLTALEIIKETLEDEELTELEKLELENLNGSNLASLPATEWLTVYSLDPEKAEALVGVEKKAMEMLDCDATLSAEEWLDLAVSNKNLTKEEKAEIAKLKASGELDDLTALEYLERIDETPIADILRDNVSDYVVDNTPGSEAIAAHTPKTDAKPDYTANAVNMADVSPMELTNPEEYLLAADLPLEKAAEELDIEHIYFDFDQSYIRKDAQKTLDKITSVLMANSDVKMYVDAHTDARGSDVYNHYLSEKRAASVKKYLKARGVNPNRLELNWYGENQLANSCDDGVACAENAHQLNRRAMFKLSKELNRTNDHMNIPMAAEESAPEEIFSPFDNTATAGLNIGLDDDELLGRAGLEVIYYDYNKSNIRPDAELILEVVAAAMKSNNKTLYINAHTDARGNDSYNAKLSQKRAKAARNYLISQGVSANKVEINWSGEVQLTNKCDDGVACTADEHQKNRRATLAWK